MKCISRSALGIIIGTINLLVYIGSLIFIIITLVAFNTMLKDASSKSNKTVTHDLHDPWDNDDEFSLTPKDEEKIPVIALSNILFTVVLVVCVIMIIISSLLIAGIVKKRHSFMAPWLILSAIGFVCSCIKTVFGLCEGAASDDIPFGKVFTAFIANCLVLGLEALILYPIYTLYKDIRDRNNERPGQVISARQVGFTSDYNGQPNYYTPVSQKV